jgi:activator of HSP90 ATPase
MKTKFEVITQTAVIDAGPDEVFQAYVDPQKHSTFTGSPATGTPEVGGRFTAWDGYIEGRYVRLEKGKKIVQEWKTSEWPEGYPPSIVELSLRPKGKKTELTMVHSRVPAEQANDYADGWKVHYWEPMARYFKKTQVAAVTARKARRR